MGDYYCSTIIFAWCCIVINDGLVVFWGQDEAIKTHINDGLVFFVRHSEVIKSHINDGVVDLCQFLLFIAPSC